jgi:hypothetical protein
MRTVDLDIGDVLETEFCEVSRVIGIDSYTLASFSGPTEAWLSYTLVSRAPTPYDRWWIVNTPGHGAYAYTAFPRSLPDGARFDAAISGLVELRSSGNADLSSERGALAMFTDAADPMILYAQEVFDDAPRLQFIGKPFDIERATIDADESYVSGERNRQSR